MVNNANTDLYISFDNRKVGEIMAQALVNALPQGGDVFMIQGSSSDNNVQMVKQGFDDMLADTDLHVVYEANCDGWTAELAAGYELRRRPPDSVHLRGVRREERKPHYAAEARGEYRALLRQGVLC